MLAIDCVLERTDGYVIIGARWKLGFLTEGAMKTKGKEFKDRAAFDAALASSTGPEIVNLDGQTVKGGILPALDFVTKQNGHIVLAESKTVQDTAPA